MARLFSLVALVAGLVVVGSLAARADSHELRGEIRDLKLGVSAADMPQEGYYQFACGSNGGPPLQPIEGWQDFAACPPEPESGLHEVYIEYDDEMAVTAKLFERLGANVDWMAKFSGTKVAGHPVVLSVLFDSEGVSRVVRAVTDSRAAVNDRTRGYMLNVPVKIRYGRRNWDCSALERLEGEEPVGDQFIKELCEKKVGDARRVVVETHLYRKPGQTGLDDDDQWIPGQFRSSGRFEVWDVAQ